MTFGMTYLCLADAAKPTGVDACWSYIIIQQLMMQWHVSDGWEYFVHQASLDTKSYKSVHIIMECH